MASLLASQSESNALLLAARWLESILQGSLVVSIATLAIAALGFAMLSGRISAQRGLVAVLGCFVVFGASALAHGIASAASTIAGENEPDSLRPAAQVEFNFVPPPSQTAPLKNADPYAGASIAQ